MILNIYTLYDSVADSYLTPFFMASDAEAKRAFANLVNDRQSLVSKTPADYILMKNGMYSTMDGSMETHIPTALGNGINFIRKEA
ncbi:MAG: hypothetical protein HGB35_03530 [Geobacteraceae bacterium]|nr:hypothetical protein [Geobacteraceae bacterium]